MLKLLAQANSSEIYRHYVEIMCKSLHFLFGIAINFWNILLTNIKHPFPLRTQENYKKKKIKAYQYNKMKGQEKKKNTNLLGKKENMKKVQEIPQYKKHLE